MFVRILHWGGKGEKQTQTQLADKVGSYNATRETMKKILLASTALVLSAGLAHAQGLTITGEGRMGVFFQDNGFVSAWTQENRLTLNFNVSVEADHGLTFGAWTRARTQSTNWGSYAGIFSGSRVWVEASGLRLTFGNIDGAIRGAGVAMGYGGGCGIGYEGGTLCGDSLGLVGNGTVSQGQSSTGVGPGSRTRIDYTFGETRVALSHDRNGNTELGVRTSFDAFTVALGYSDGDAFIFGDVWTISGHYDGGSWGVGALITDFAGWTNYAISGNVNLGGGDLYGFVGQLYDDATYGISYGYDLGGGATLTVGAEHTAYNDVTFGSVGVAFTF